jgi:hypothetical protein
MLKVKSALRAALDTIVLYTNDYVPSPGGGGHVDSEVHMSLSVLDALRAIVSPVVGPKEVGRSATKVNAGIPVDVSVIDAIREIEAAQRNYERATGVDIIYTKITLDEAKERGQGVLDERAGIAFRLLNHCYCGGDWLLRAVERSAVAECQQCWYTETRPLVAEMPKA